MSRFTSSFAGSIAALLCVACSSTQLALDPLEGQRELALTYRTSSEPLAFASPVEARAQLPAGEGEARVRVSFVRLSTAESEALFGPVGARVVAVEVDPAELERALASIQAQSAARIVEACSVRVPERAPGEVRVSKQCAYVAAFELSQTPQVAVADPVVLIAEEGFLLRIERLAAAADSEFDVDLALSDLERPMRERVVELPGSGIPVTLQTPACSTQRIQTRAALSGESALMIGGIPAPEAGQTVLVVMRREPWEREFYDDGDA